MRFGKEGCSNDKRFTIVLLKPTINYLDFDFRGRQQFLFHAEGASLKRSFMKRNTMKYAFSPITILSLLGGAAFLASPNSVIKEAEPYGDKPLSLMKRAIDPNSIPDSKIVEKTSRVRVSTLGSISIGSKWDTDYRWYSLFTKAYDLYTVKAIEKVRGPFSNFLPYYFDYDSLVSGAININTTIETKEYFERAYSVVSTAKLSFSFAATIATAADLGNVSISTESTVSGGFSFESSSYYCYYETTTTSISMNINLDGDIAKEYCPEDWSISVGSYGTYYILECYVDTYEDLWTGDRLLSDSENRKIVKIAIPDKETISSGYIYKNHVTPAPSLC